MRKYIALAYAALLAAGIPWYWPRGDRTLVLGVPAWVAAAVLAGAAAAALTIWYLREPWPGEDEEDDVGGGGDER